MKKNAKIGRNDPCPCGSGKKYKKCCALLEGFIDMKQDKFFNYNKMLSSIKDKLNRYYSNQIKQDRVDSQNQFVRYTVDKKLAGENETLFSDWLWFDKADIRRRTPGLNYLEENAEFFEKPILDLLVNLNSSYLSVYESGMVEDHVLELTDIFSGQKTQVLLKDPEEIDDEKKLLLLGRLAKISGDTIFSGMVLVIESDSSQKPFLQNHMNYMQELYGLDSADLLKQSGEIIYGLFDHAYRRTFFNLNDIKIAKTNCQAGFKDILVRDNEYEFVHKAKGFEWYRPKGRKNGYIRIAIGDEYIIICADTLDDILAQQEIAKQLVGDSEIQTVSNLLWQKPPLAEFTSLWFLVLKDQETERWLDTNHVELGNLTPREVLQQEDGHEKLTKLLDDFNSAVHTSEETELIEYMKMRIQQ